MANGDRASLQLRAQEILSAHPEGMTARAAMKQALSERYKHDPDGLAEFAAGVSQSWLSGLRKGTYELPDDGQGSLFQTPEVIAIRTDDGDLLVHRDSATLGQVRQWVKEAQQHHGTQSLRFKRFGKQIDQLKEEPDELPWPDARNLGLAIEHVSEADE